MATSDYWQVAHGLEKGEVCQDTEGVEVMRKLGRNIAWLVQLIAHGKGTVAAPETGARTMTTFVR